MKKSAVSSQRGYIMVLAVVVLLVFMVVSFALFRTYLLDTKHQIKVVEFDQTYFLAEGAKERAMHYYRWELPYQHDGDTSNDPAQITIRLDGLLLTVKVDDTFQ